MKRDCYSISNTQHLKIAEARNRKGGLRVSARTELLRRPAAAARLDKSGASR
jgi:hypothetical protein